MSLSEDALSVTKPKAREDVVFRSLSKEWVLYDPRTQLLHVLNPTAAIVWSCCDGLRSVEDMASELGETLTETPAQEQIVNDVQDALRRFSDEGLLE